MRHRIFSSIPLFTNLLSLKIDKVLIKQIIVVAISLGIAAMVSHSNTNALLLGVSLTLSANMSKYHFIRLFNQQFGLTPYQYVINCRVNLARQYIELGFAASRVALDAGFSDNSHLNRHFKRVFGITIKHYQRQLSL